MVAEISDDEYAKMVFEEGDSLVVDLSNVEELKFELVPKGIYPAIVDKCEYKISNNSGAPMFEFMLALDGGEYANRKFFFYASFSPKALSGTKSNLLRLAPDLFEGVFKPQEIAESGVVLGRACRVKIGHEDYQGETRAKIQSLLAANEGSGGNGDGFFPS